MMLLNPPWLSAALLAFQATTCLANLVESVKERSLNGTPPTLQIISANSTTKWFEGTDKVQIIEVTIQNTGTTVWLTKDDALSLVIASTGLNTIRAGTVTRLRPGDSVIVKLGVQNYPGIAQGSTGPATVEARWGKNYGHPMKTTFSFTATQGFGPFDASAASLSTHSAPEWFQDAKYGIFIHWGVYAVPAWGNTGANEKYAEWYWSNMHHPSSGGGTYQYHKSKYGPNVKYDDFIKNFTASKYDPKAWVQLFADAGAQYFVPTTKHHDGFAIFNTSTSISMRSSVSLGPKRDLLRELFDAAKRYQPQLRRGTYYSLPEWYNPLEAKYHISYNFPGGPPYNPYTGATEEYTGFVNHTDYVTGIQLPQMQELSYNYETDIMWCDIGHQNNSTIWASEWLNWAAARNRQVTFNNRCGIGGDYRTPEYTTFHNSVLPKWESSRGMDPHSYGFNSVTPDSAYMTANDIIQTLIDIISKNGNFLLDIGPRADGTIIQVCQDNLRAAGKWIKAHSESIFATSIWLRTPGVGNLRYTTKPDAFYIHVLSKPGATVNIPDPVPWLPGDTVTVVGGTKPGTVCGMAASGSGYVLSVPAGVADADQYIWTFKITYGT